MFNVTTILGLIKLIVHLIDNPPFGQTFAPADVQKIATELRNAEQEIGRKGGQSSGQQQPQQQQQQPQRP
jgi:hypothetical protein